MSTLAMQFKSIPTFRDLKGRFARAEQGLLEDRRKIMKTLGAKYVVHARNEAPGSGKFAKKIIFRTFVTGDSVGFNTYIPQPLGKWIILGTKPHAIVAKNVRSLKFFWAKGPKGAGIYFYVSVWHPGTKPNPFLSRAYRRWRPEARTELRRISTRYKKKILGE